MWVCTSQNSGFGGVNPWTAFHHSDSLLSEAILLVPSGRVGSVTYLVGNISMSRTGLFVCSYIWAKKLQLKCPNSQTEMIKVILEFYMAKKAVRTVDTFV